MEMKNHIDYNKMEYTVFYFVIVVSLFLMVSLLNACNF